MNTRLPKIYLFHCANGFEQTELLRSYATHIHELNVVSLPCSGKLDILYLTKAFDTGADGAAIMICEEGKCHYMEGNLRARKRAEAVDALLQEAGLGNDRITVIQLDEKGLPEAIRKLEAFRLHIQSQVQDTAHACAAPS
jgi:coenzyme F420-reducing hydrogenase delta subunit